MHDVSRRCVLLIGRISVGRDDIDDAGRLFLREIIDEADLELAGVLNDILG